MNFFKHNWWKYLGAILLLYTVTAGLLVPLNPGIQELSSTRLIAGQNVNLTISGYNTFFTTQDHRAFIRLSEDQHIEAYNISVSDDQLIQADFRIPSEIENEVEDVTLIVSNEATYFIYPNMTIVKREVGSDINALNQNPSVWSTQELELPDKSWKFRFPNRVILVETIRNTFFHVAIWMSQFVLLAIALWYSIQYLRTSEIKYDHWASSFTFISLVYGVIGIATGSVWARFTWGAFWANDVKLNMAAISVMIYLAYAILRSSIDDHDKRARTSAIYNIFAFSAMIPLIMIIPRLTDSLHPGNGGNPAFGTDDMDNTLRMVFYPAIIALILIGGWYAQILIRSKNIEEKLINRGLND